MDWRMLISTFGLLFLAELGDKTQLAVIAQTCKTDRPWAVFLGATLALTVVTGLAVLVGQSLTLVLPQQVLRKAAAASFVVMGALVWFGVL